LASAKPNSKDTLALPPVASKIGYEEVRRRFWITSIRSWASWFWSLPTITKEIGYDFLSFSMPLVLGSNRLPGHPQEDLVSHRLELRLRHCAGEAVGVFSHSVAAPDSSRP
jgi:hypothetical protein